MDEEVKRYKYFVGKSTTVGFWSLHFLVNSQTLLTLQWFKSVLTQIKQPYIGTIIPVMITSHQLFKLASEKALLVYLNKVTWMKSPYVTYFRWNNLSKMYPLWKRVVWKHVTSVITFQHGLPILFCLAHMTSIDSNLWLINSMSTSYVTFHEPTAFVT